jgi:histidine decarboxylase
MKKNSDKKNFPVEENLFKIGSQKMSQESRDRALETLSNYFRKQQKNFLGYQVNNSFDYKIAKEFFDIHINNVGDPFVHGNMTINTKVVEKAVLEFYAKLWRNTLRHEESVEEDDYWGYILSMGSTEANMFGLLSGRDYLEGKHLLIDDEGKRGVKFGVVSENKNSLHPIAFFSQDTHYSIVKAMEVLKIDTFFDEAMKQGYKSPLEMEDYPVGFSSKYLENGWCKEVPSDENGAIYIPALKKLVEFFASKGHPILISFNYGSTFKGAYDNIGEAFSELKPILEKYGLFSRKLKVDDEVYDRDGFWFHVDGALGASYMPFIEKALKSGKITNPENYKFPEFDFIGHGVHSLSMSGHKYMGSPFPTGIYMTRHKYQLKPVDNPMYIGSPDTTFAGSRNGLSALIFWEYLSERSEEEHISEAVRCELLARRTFKELKERDKRGVAMLNRNPFSLSIRMKLPEESIVEKYSLAKEVFFVKNRATKFAHIYIMRHVTDEVISEFIEDLEKSNYF